MNGKQVQFLRTLYPCKSEDGTIIPACAAGFYKNDVEMQRFAQQLITAGLLEPRGVDSCGTAWFWPTCFNEIFSTGRKPVSGKA